MRSIQTRISIVIIVMVLITVGTIMIISVRNRGFIDSYSDRVMKVSADYAVLVMNDMIHDAEGDATSALAKEASETTSAGSGNAFLMTEDGDIRTVFPQLSPPCPTTTRRVSSCRLLSHASPRLRTLQNRPHHPQTPPQGISQNY